MPELSRAQLLVYGAIGVALLLVGARWVREDDPGASPDAGVAEASAPGGAEDAASGPFQLDSHGGDVVVHVAGAVGRSGVYTLPAGSRVDDAIKRAGGPTGVADVDGINLAARLVDGQQVIMPSSVKSAAGVAEGSATGGTATDGSSDGPISLGSATTEELDTIEGIGPVTAADIIEFRDQHGVGSIDELDQVPGIGPVTMEALRQRLQP
jgi:competence protein ComEA